MVEIKKNLVSKDKYNVKCPYSMTPEYITVHNTANDASAEKEINYMISNNNQVSYHYAVDDIQIVQGVPTDRNTWNAGDGGSGTGNRKSIAIEICYSKSGGDKFIKAEKNTAEFIASLLKEKGWGIDRVKKHQDWNGKYCPHRTLDMGWDRFIDMIKSHLNGGTTTKPQPSTNTSTTTQTSSKQTVTLPANTESWAVYDLNVQPVKKNVKAYLKPSKFGGLTYDILGWSMTDVAIIETRDYGKVQIYVAKSTGAVISNKKSTTTKKTTTTTTTKTNSSKKLYLPASSESWRIYPLNKKPVKGNECGYLKPSKFGGLTYDIIRYTQTDVAVIKTRDFGEVQIYVAASTGAVIK